MRGTVGLVAVLVISAGAYGAGPGGPPNDAPEDARVIESLPFHDEVDTTGATGSADERTDCPEDHFGRTIWYRYRSERDVTVEFAVDEGVYYVDVFPVGSCDPAEMDVYGSEAVLHEDVEYLIRATVGEGATTFAVREFVPIEPAFDAEAVARLEGGELVVDGTFVCARAGDLRYSMYAVQPPYYGAGPLVVTETALGQFDCAGDIPVSVRMKPDADDSSVPLLPGPFELYWDTYQCVDDDFRWEGWRDCRGLDGTFTGVVVPAS